MFFSKLEARIYIWHHRWQQIFQYGWIDSDVISKKIKENGGHKSRISIFCDIVYSYIRYHLWSNQYLKLKYWSLSKEDRSKLGEKYKIHNGEYDADFIDRRIKNRLVEKRYWKNHRFLQKYTSMYWDRSPRLQEMRNRAYRKRYNMGVGNIVQYGVTLISEHMVEGKLEIGEKVLLARGVDLDYTGGLSIGNGVSIAEGAKILTHGHCYLGVRKDYLTEYGNTYATPLRIGNNVFVGVHAVIMPGVTSIGENSIISVGSVVTRPVPPNSIVSGNPAKAAPIPAGMRTLYRWKGSEFLAN